MLVITTKYVKPTDTRGSKVRASCGRFSKTIGWDNSLGTAQNHQAAAKALAEKMSIATGRNTPRTWAGGGVDGGAYVFITGASQIFTE